MLLVRVRGENINGIVGRAGFKGHNLLCLTGLLEMYTGVGSLMCLYRLFADAIQIRSSRADLRVELNKNFSSNPSSTSAHMELAFL